METGTVKFFDVREGKRFGFVVVETGLWKGKEVFFHGNDVQFIKAGKEEPEFTGSATNTYKGKTYRQRDPKPGDMIVFHVTQGYRGDKASPWAHKSNYDWAIEVIAKRPAPTTYTYRVLEVMNSIGKQPGEPKVLWEGSDLDDLLRRYPVPSGRQSPSADPLLPYSSDSDNIFEVHRWFERKTEAGWERCSDPRPLSGANRQFERITHGR